VVPPVIVMLIAPSAFPHASSITWTSSIVNVLALFETLTFPVLILHPLASDITQEYIPWSKLDKSSVVAVVFQR